MVAEIDVIALLVKRLVPSLANFLKRSIDTPPKLLKLKSFVLHEKCYIQGALSPNFLNKNREFTLPLLSPFMTFSSENSLIRRIFLFIPNSMDHFVVCSHIRFSVL